MTEDGVEGDNADKSDEGRECIALQYHRLSRKKPTCGTGITPTYSRTTSKKAVTCSSLKLW